MEEQYSDRLKIYYFDGRAARCEQSFYHVCAYSYDECLDLLKDHREYDYLVSQIPSVELAPVKGDIVEDVHYC